MTWFLRSTWIFEKAKVRCITQSLSREFSHPRTGRREHIFILLIRPTHWIYNNPVQLSTKSITQNPLIGIYWWVIILIVSCATRPPRKAAVLGRSALGARTLCRETQYQGFCRFRREIIRTLLQQHTRIPQAVSYQVRVEFVLQP